MYAWFIFSEQAAYKIALQSVFDDAAFSAAERSLQLSEQVHGKYNQLYLIGLLTVGALHSKRGSVFMFCICCLKYPDVFCTLLSLAPSL